MRTPALRRRQHPPPRELSRYLDGELPAQERQALESHLLDCPGCRRILHSIASTVRALGALQLPSSPGLVDAIIAEVRMGESSRRAPNALAAGAGERAGFAERLSRRGSDLHRTWLWATIPIAFVLGVVLSLVNQGDMLLSGEVNLRMCAACALDFLLPFFALNVALAIAANVARDRG